MSTDFGRILERYYTSYDFSARQSSDPVYFPSRYRKTEDIEVVGFIAAALAYGRVDLFMPVIDRILGQMGDSPAAFLYDFSVSRERRRFDGIKYRFNEPGDILCLLFMLHKVLRAKGTLQGAFMEGYSDEDADIGRGLSRLMHALLQVRTKSVYGSDVRPPGLLQFFPLPERGSACKRANLYLRWMVRDGETDFGIWKHVPKRKLVIPLDTHIARIATCLKLTSRKTQDWKMAVEITTALRRFDPADPLKYDFALCHLGISGACTARRGPSCRACVLKQPAG